MSNAFSNSRIAEALEELADLYELDGAIAHRVLAYRKAARTIGEATTSVAALALAGRASELPGIGATLQEKVQALVESGTIPAAEALRAKFPPGVLDMTRVPGLGPKRARQLYEELGIDSLNALRDAAAQQRLRTLRGLGAKFEANVLAAIGHDPPPRRSERFLLPRALELAEALARALGDAGPPDVIVRLAGSIRRRAETAKDIDLIACTSEGQKLHAVMKSIELVDEVTASGEHGMRARLHAGIGVDLRIGEHREYGNLLQHFTGSGAHNAALRERAARSGLHISEYSVADEHTGARHKYESEAEIYDLLGLAYIEPELREDRGEIEAAADGGAGLPALIALEQIRGDLHCHTTASDGRASIREMALAAKARGYQYIAITDHSASHGFGNAVSPEALRRQIEHVAAANAQIEGIEILAGSEVNILPDGSLDYEDELLAQLDWVIASVHTAFSMNEQRMTERIRKAMEHPLVDAIGHPTGRLIERRQPYDLDIEALIEGAAQTATMLEINANPLRRDLSEQHARAAAQAGVLLLIDSDAHSSEDLALMRWGIDTARRAWLQSSNVANTRSLADFQQLRKPARSAGSGS